MSWSRSGGIDLFIYLNRVDSSKFSSAGSDFCGRFPQRWHCIDRCDEVPLNMDGITFIAYHAPGKSVREKNLLLSSARSHAARISSDRRRTRKKLVEQISAEHGPVSRKDQANSQDEDGIELVVQQTFRRIFSPSSGSHDPFGSFPVRLDGNLTASVRMFEIIWARLGLVTVPTSADIKGAVRKSATQVIQQCMQDDLPMDAFRAAMYLRRNVFIHRPTLPAQHAGKAIRQLRGRVETSQSIPSSLLMPILLLAWYELYHTDLSACRSHLRVLKLLNAFETFDSYTQRFARGIDVASAMPDLSQPIFSDVPRQRTYLLEDRDGGKGFELHTEVLGQRLVETASYIVDETMTAEICAQLFIQKVGITPIMVRFGVRAWELPYQLLSELPASPIQEACVAALGRWLLYTPFATLESSPKLSVGADIVTVLHHWGRRPLDRLEISGERSELTIWIATTGMVFSFSQESFLEYALMITALACELGVSDLREVLRQYLWTEVFRFTDALIHSTIDRIDAFVLQEKVADPTTLEGLREELAQNYLVAEAEGPPQYRKR